MAMRTRPTERQEPPHPSRQHGGQHQGLHRPSEDQRVEQALDHASLDDFGETTEDQIRDRRGSGIPAIDQADDKSTGLQPDQR